jgi:microsomal dipeptidase-like Zn-dependent dipeptidase
MPSWFGGNLDFENVTTGLRNTGMDSSLIAKVMGLNWCKFFESSFEPKT